MRSRFKKVWCPSCSTMQFAGECGHGRIVEPCPVDLAAFEWSRFLALLMRTMSAPKPYEQDEAFSLAADG
jgi:hypothetical protein